MKYSTYERTDIGKVRSENQDAIFSDRENAVFLVADGMGGEKAGADASARVVQTVREVTWEYFKSKTPQKPADIEALIRTPITVGGGDRPSDVVRVKPAQKGRGRPKHQRNRPRRQGRAARHAA